MDVRTWFSPDVWRLNKTLWILIVAAFSAIFVFITTPWLALGAIAVLIGAILLATRREGICAKPLPSLPTWLVAAAACVAYLLVSLLWTADLKSTAISALVAAYAFAGIHLAALLLQAAPALWLEHITRAMLAAFIAALLFLLFEELSGHFIKKMLFWPFVAARWHNGAMAFDSASGLVKIPPHRVKWNIPPVNLLLWPMLLICLTQLGRLGARWVQVVLVAATCWLIVLAEHRTSQAALLAAVPTFLLARWNALIVRRLLAIAWVASFIIIIPVALTSYRAEMHLHGRVGDSMAARIILWHFTAQKLHEHPILGVGAAATKRIDNDAQKIKAAPQPDGYFYPMRTGPHAHNVFLQSWYELGAFGTMIFALFGLLVLPLTTIGPREAQPYMLATATTVLVTISASFGLFETWFMGALALCAITAMTALTYYRRNKPAD